MNFIYRIMSFPTFLSLTSILLFLVLNIGILSTNLQGEDWPEWRGKGRKGVWTEDGILTKFPKSGLKFSWKTPIQSGFSGPAVADGRVYITDYQETPGTRTMDGIERLICLDEETGKIIWIHEWETTYRRLMPTYATGPRATPTVDGDRVYALGATGKLRCVNTRTGELLWQRDYIEDFGTQVPTWGITGAPLVDGERLICVVGGEPDSRVVAFNKRSGEVIWRALSSDWEMGYEQPIVIESGGTRQLIVWHPRAVSSLNPETGTVFWEKPFEVQMGMTVATPVFLDSHLLVSQFYGGSMLLHLDERTPEAELVWKIGGTSELPERTRGLHALNSTPVIQDGYIYGICSYGQLRCLELQSGDRKWETFDMTELGRWASAFIVKHQDHYFINNDLGDLIIARFTPSGYVEVDRTRLIEPTTNSAWGSGRRVRPSDRIVNWSHPAYANQHVVARNDREIIRASLVHE